MLPLMRRAWSRHFLHFAILLVTGSEAMADDWPQWLGPKRDSIWRESNIIERFSPLGPVYRWRSPIGAGYSGPIVARGRVYVTDRQMPVEASAPVDPFQRASVRGQERVLCFDETDGRLLWHYDYDCAYTMSYPAGPRVAPLVHAGKVYTLGAEGHLLCLDAESGIVVWAKDLKQEYGLKTPMWGFAGHPLVDGDRLICQVGGAGTTVIALNKDNGKELWRALSSEEPGYSSPAIYSIAGKQQLIIFHPQSVNSLDPRSGRVFWSVPFKSNTGLSVATPRSMGDELFCTSFYNGAMMLQIAPAAAGARPLWQTTKANEKETTHLNSILCTPFLEKGYVYGVCSYGQLRCLDARTGQRVWESLRATTDGNPVRWANAFIVKQSDRFFLFNEKGELIIARLTASGYEELSRAKILEPTNKDCGRLVVWSHPAFANRCVFARNDKQLVCVDLGER
jgi:outer membrane protein assembly factor BamB